MSEAPSAGCVFLVDDDASVRRALARRLRVAGFDVEAFESAAAFLAREPRDAGACIVTDYRMPGMTGLELQVALADAGREIPIVFISGHGDVPTSVQAMRAGAVHFLRKPFTGDEILGAVTEALELGAQRGEARRTSDAVRERYATLTARERQVFRLVVEGLMNKVIADRLGTAEKTVKIHRGRVMAKMGTRSVADLVRMASLLPGP